MEEVIDRVAGIGYDGLEVVGEPDEFPADKYAQMIREWGMKVNSICGMHLAPEPGDLRYLGHKDGSERQNAVDYVKWCVDMAKGCGAPGVLVVPGQVTDPGYFSVSKDENCKTGDVSRF
jgi:sugar phosphate isomerase/epimerase